MKCTLCFLILLAINISRAQVSREVFSLSPDHPKVGETVSVVYNSESPKAVFRDAKEITLDVFMYMGDFKQDYLRELPMKSDGKVWESSFVLDDPKVKLLLFRFVSGEKVDDNDDNVWASMVYANDGLPVKGAHYGQAQLYRYGIRSFKRTHDENAARAEFLAEKERYPDSWDAASTLWDMTLQKDPSDSSKARMKAELDVFYEKDKMNDSLLSRYVAWYNALGDSSKAREIRETGVPRNPRGLLARSVRWGDIRKETTPQKKVEFAEKYFAEFPDLDSTDTQNKLSTVFYYCIQANDVDKAIKIISQMTKPAAYNYSQIVTKLMAKEDRLREAVAFAKKAVELSNIVDSTARSYYKTQKEWNESVQEEKATSYDKYGQALLKIGDLTGAEGSFGEAYKLSQGDDVELDARYLGCLVSNKKFDTAMEVGRTCIAKGKSNDNLVNYFKEAFAGREGAKEGFEKLSNDKQKEFDGIMADAHNEMVAAMKKKVIESRISKPSIDFTLKNLEGTPVMLSALKGKVVVLDFWATWCGPCKMSFPFLQKVYDKYKANQKVVFLAINTWERQKDYDATVANAKKFVVDNKYSFPVFIDADNNVIDKYGVEGIPTKFVIDSKSDIAFKTVGFDGPEMEEELTQQIELLLAEAVN
ncbi:MAG: TlpA disulfide reductase family protein [Bacteroidota bacterium]|jgi:thiol-disulfide isomerase/thioredoxin